MSLKPLLDQILYDEHLTRTLDDAEARMLVEWLVDQAEQCHAVEHCEQRLRHETSRLYRRARAVARFVTLWCHDRAFGTAMQLAGAERFAWPLPTQPLDACDLMREILAWETASERLKRL
jgi:hypothetical protein